jgi:transposase InsO family protein
MKEWYTNAEFAALKLPAFPDTESGVWRWFKTNDVDARAPHRVRCRKERGGGVERHISALPTSLQSCIRLRHLKVVEAPAVALPAVCETQPSTVGAALRRDAILTLLGFWDVFRQNHEGSVEVQRHLFTGMYRNGRISGLPEWVRQALTSASGRPIGVSVTTLKRWTKLRETGDFASLGGNYGGRKGSGVLDKAEGGDVGLAISAYIVQQPHLTADHIRDLIADRFGQTLDIDGKPRPLPSLRSFERHIARWKADHADALTKLTDPDAWKNKYRFSGTNMNHWVTAPNMLWEIDASPADVLLTDGRYSIYAVIDIYTRRMMVSVTRTPKTEAVLALVRRAIMAWGVPEVLRTDNGSDFVSHAFKRAMSALAIHQDITAPFSPEQKGTVERAIGTLQRGLMPLLPGFVGHNVADRKKIEARRSFAARLGESDQNTFCVDLDHEGLQTTINQWVETKYLHRPHKGIDGQTPFERNANWNGVIKRLENERALDIMLAPIAGSNGIRTVTKTGIALDRARFMHPALRPGSRVFCRHDPDDLGRIYVYSENGEEFIGVAVCPERVGVDPGDAIRLNRSEQTRRMAEEVAPLQREIRARKPYDMVDGVLRESARKSGVLTAFPAPSKPHTTPSLEAAADAVSSNETPAAPTLDAPEDAARKAFVAGFQAEQENIHQLPDTPGLRFQRALELQTQLENGDTPSDEDTRWLLGYVQTAEYRARKSLHDDFKQDRDTKS